MENEAKRIELSDLHLGSIDGRFEISHSNEAVIDDIFYRPSYLSLEAFDQRRYYFIYGNRGVGKTSVIRWLHYKRVQSKLPSKVILFKSDITEDERSDISNAVGYSVEQTDASKMEFSQDFKQAWIWFLLHKIGEQIAAQPSLIEKAADRAKVLDLMGLGENGRIDKILGWLPKIKNKKIKFVGTTGALKAEFEGDLD
ncbi:MAG: hypothetical protein ACX94D_00270 [Henriciella sp.]